MGLQKPSDSFAPFSEASDSQHCLHLGRKRESPALYTATEERYPPGHLPEKARLGSTARAAIQLPMSPVCL